jgi:hypothetical protein
MVLILLFQNCSVMERHTTRGGWKPVKHDRILKPEFHKNDEESGSGRSADSGPPAFPIYPNLHGNAKDKFLDQED